MKASLAVIIAIFLMAGIVTAQAITICPSTINSPGIYALNQSLSSSGTCITINSDNVTLDCRGYTITGNGGGYGVYNPGYVNVTIKNCIITGFNTGIYYCNPQTLNEVDYCYTPAFCIAPWNCPNYTGNGANNGLIINNTVSSNSNIGISIEWSANNNLINDTANNNVGRGMSLVWYSSNNALISNTVINNTGDGIKIDTSSNNNLTSNIINSNNNGVYIYTLIYNGPSSGNILTNNSINSNKQMGVTIISSGANILTNNSINSNALHGIDLGASSGSTITNNTANGPNQQDGIYLSGSSSNNIANNTANSNAGYGLYVTNSTGNTFANNVFNSNANASVYLEGPVRYINVCTGNCTGNCSCYQPPCSLGKSFCTNYCPGCVWGPGGPTYPAGNDVFTSNTLTGGTCGFDIRDITRNNFTSNIITGNSYGIRLNQTASNNSIYNNYFNNSVNAVDTGNNFWNTTKTLGTNIIGGPYLGGNYWSDYNGHDTNWDGLGDTNLPYNSSGNISNGGDYLPLIPVPVAALKGGPDGYLYIPNASKLDPTGSTTISYLKIDLWCNMSDTDCQTIGSPPVQICGCNRTWCDQTGGTSPYPTIKNWPDGKIRIDDTLIVSTAFGSNEGDTAPPQSKNWSYMADCIPDRKIRIDDVLRAASGFGANGYYSANLTNINVKFNNNPSFFTPVNGYIPIPPGAVNFTVYNGTNPRMALVTFYNKSYPPTNYAITIVQNQPTDSSTIATRTVPYNYTPTWYNSVIQNCSIWDNHTGTFAYLGSNATALANNAINTITYAYASDYSNLKWAAQCCNTSGTCNMTNNFTLTIATSNPTIIVAWNSPTNNTWNRSQTITHGFTPIWYNINLASCSLWTNKTGSFVLAASNSTALTNNTVNTIQFNYATDSSQIWSYINCTNTLGTSNFTSNYTIKIDTTAPTTTANGNGYTFGTWTKNSPVSVTLSCSDATSGCSATKYCVDTQNNCTPSTYYSSSVTISTEGISYIRYNSTDNVGNNEVVNSQTIKIDTTPPTYSANSTNSTLMGTSISHNLNWADVRGLSGYIFSWDNGSGVMTNSNWTAFTPGMCSTPYTSCWSNVSKVVNSTFGAVIRWCIYANDTNNNLNSTSCTTPFNYTTTSATPVISPVDGMTYSTTNVSLKVIGSADNWFYTLNYGPAIPFTPNTTITASECSNLLYVYANSSGNLSYTTVFFKVNVVPGDTNCSKPQPKMVYPREGDNVSGFVVLAAGDLSDIPPYNMTNVSFQYYDGANWHTIDSTNGTEPFWNQVWDTQNLTSGNYSVGIHIESASGTGDGSVTVHVYKGPVANFTVYPDYTREDTIIFDASSSSDPDGTIQDYIWIFNETETRHGAVVSHLILSPGPPSGTYNIPTQLIVRDSHRAASTMHYITRIHYDETGHPISIELVPMDCGCQSMDIKNTGDSYVNMWWMPWTSPQLLGPYNNLNQTARRYQMVYNFEVIANLVPPSNPGKCEEGQQVQHSSFSGFGWSEDSKYGSQSIDYKLKPDTYVNCPYNVSGGIWCDDTYHNTDDIYSSTEVPTKEQGNKVKFHIGQSKILWMDGPGSSNITTSYLAIKFRFSAKVWGSKGWCSCTWDVFMNTTDGTNQIRSKVCTHGMP